MVTKLDPLAFSVAHLMEIWQRLEERGTRLKIIALNLDTSTPTGNLMLNLLGSVAELEREIIRSSPPIMFALVSIDASGEPLRGYSSSP